MELYNFNGTYISSPLALNIGHYKLTKFMVLDSTGKVIYATPVKGSPKAYLVQNPLDISFTISEEAVTKLTPEVISTDESVPADFGYLDATFQVVNTFDFLVSVFVYDAASQNFQLTSASITISDSIKDLYTLPIDAKTNKISVNDGFGTYKITVSKTGFASYVKTYTADSLKACFNKPLTIVLNTSSVDITAGLVAYYPFNGNTNDESGNGNNGTVYGATLTTDRFGNANRAYSFNGIDNYIKVQNPKGLNNSNYTYSFWLKILQLPATYFCNFIMEFGYPDMQGHAIAINNDYPSINQTSGWSVNSANTVVSSFNFQAGTLPSVNVWYNIILVRDDTSVCVYENNKIINSVLTNGEIAYYTDPINLYIGASVSFPEMRPFKIRVNSKLRINV